MTRFVETLDGHFVAVAGIDSIYWHHEGYCVAVHYGPPRRHANLSYVEAMKVLDLNVDDMSRWISERKLALEIDQEQAA